MSDIDSIFSYSKEYPWCVSDPNDYPCYFRSKKDAENYANNQVIPDYLDGDGWVEGVEQVIIYKVHLVAKQYNLIEKPDDLDEDEYWVDHDYKCQHKMKKL